MLQAGSNQNTIQNNAPHFQERSRGIQSIIERPKFYYELESKSDVGFAQ